LLPTKVPIIGTTIFHDKSKKKQIQKEIAEFNPDSYPKDYSRKEKELFCTVFGHVCQVFLVGEPFTETGRLRHVSGYISRIILLIWGVEWATA
jgi:hypothetical protein